MSNETYIPTSSGTWTYLFTYKQVTDKFLVYKYRCTCGNERFFHEKILRKKKLPLCKECGPNSYKNLTPPVSTRNFLGPPNDPSLCQKKSDEFISWQRMKKSCYDPSCWFYKHCGDKGIGVHKEWRHSFDTFLADMGKKPIGVGRSLKRRDKNKDFSKENCYWGV